MPTSVLTPALLAASERGLQRTFLKYWEAADLGGWDGLFTRAPSTGAGENYPVPGAAPTMAAFPGPRVFSGISTYAMTVTNREFDVGIAIPRRDIERDRLGVYDGAIQEMATSAKLYVVDLVAALLAAGTGTTLGRCWDGKALFAADHGKGKGTAQTNIITGSGVDTSAHVQTDIAQAVAAFATWKDDQGKN